MESITGILAVIMIFGMPIAIVGILSFNRARNAAELQKTLRASIEKGQPLPTEFIESMSRAVPRAKNPMNDIRWGLIWMAISGGIFFATYIENGEIFRHGSGIAAIPGLIGLVLVIFGIIGLNTREKS